MVEYDSDSSGANDVETGVTLGYASKEPTGDDFSQLGGHPTWLDSKSPPAGNLAKCKVCNGLLNLLFQLNGDLPDRYPGHERRLYLFGCRRKACRRKNGGVRGLRYSSVDSKVATVVSKTQPTKIAETKSEVPTKVSNLGNTLFGVQPAQSTASTNPFGAPTTSSDAPAGSVSSNPFGLSPSTSSTTKLSINNELSQTFAEKARIGTPQTSAQSPAGPAEPWPEMTSFPQPYPSYYIDADKEFLDSEPAEIPQQTRLEELDAEPGSSNTSDDKSAFESTMDKTFQKFADRMAQNPEQVLRYEFGGQPLLYSKKDTIGRTWPQIPRCSKCGGQRQFELQLTPHAITELEAEEDSIEGMDWGTVILAVCGNDCEGWSEEWVGVQWEELGKAS